MPGMNATMQEFGRGELHSGSKGGPIVSSRRQAIAIGLNEARKAGADVPPPPASMASLLRGEAHRRRRK